jgi:hypothetical protein
VRRPSLFLAFASPPRPVRLILSLAPAITVTRRSTRRPSSHGIFVAMGVKLTKHFFFANNEAFLPCL